MFKSQMKFQKILCYTALILSAVLFVYAVGFITDLYDLVYFTLDIDEGLDYTEVEGTEFFWELQTIVTYEEISETKTIKHRQVGFNEQLVIVAIIAVLVAVSMFVSNSHTRRKYYLGNYFTTALLSSYFVGVAVWMSNKLTYFKTKYMAIDFEQLERYCKVWKREYNPSTRCFDIGFVISAILLIVAVLAIINLIWKITLVKRENKLLRNVSGEVAHD